MLTGKQDAVGFLRLESASGTVYFLWIDNTGDLRISTTATDRGTTNGTVVGSQS